MFDASAKVESTHSNVQALPLLIYNAPTYVHDQDVKALLAAVQELWDVHHRRFSHVVEKIASVLEETKVPQCQWQLVC